MPHFVIAGERTCSKYLHAVQIAHALSEKLPNFTVTPKEFEPAEWNKYLNHLHKSKGWFVTTSPVIWKEITDKAIRIHLIGGLSEFWEYIDDYYNVVTFFDSETIEKLALDRIESFKTEAQLKKEGSVVGIYGFTTNYAQMLLSELFGIINLFHDKMVTIKIYDPKSVNQNDKKVNIMSVIESIIPPTEIMVKLRYSSNLPHFVKYTQWIFITEEYTWIKVCQNELALLANEINKSGLDNVKIICSHTGPTCLTGTVLTKYTYLLHKNLVYAVTAHEGLKALSAVCASIDLPVSQLSAPPVWGLPGFKHYVDVNSIIVEKSELIPEEHAMAKILRGAPFKVTITKKLQPLWHNVDWRTVEPSITQHNINSGKLGRKPFLALLRATVDLVKLWFSPKSKRDNIISLGVVSNGAFGITEQIVFSQPVILNENNVWVPYERIPISDQTRAEIEVCIRLGEEMVRKMDECFEKNLSNPVGI